MRPLYCPFRARENSTVLPTHHHHPPSALVPLVICPTKHSIVSRWFLSFVPPHYHRNSPRTRLHCGLPCLSRQIRISTVFSRAATLFVQVSDLEKRRVHMEIPLPSLIPHDCPSGLPVSPETSDGEIHTLVFRSGQGNDSESKEHTFYPTLGSGKGTATTLQMWSLPRTFPDQGSSGGTTGRKGGSKVPEAKARIFFFFFYRGFPTPKPRDSLGCRSCKGLQRPNLNPNLSLTFQGVKCNP